MAQDKKDKKEKKSTNLITDGLDLILILLIAVILWRAFAGGLEVLVIFLIALPLL